MQNLWLATNFWVALPPNTALRAVASPAKYSEIDMDCLLNYTKQQIIDKLAEVDITGYRTQQIFVALWQGKTFSEMNIPQSLKQVLGNNFASQPVSILDKKVASDGTIKFLFKLLDNNIIEGVLMKYKYGYTLCVSTQVGCRMGCKFCASTLHGLVRNLSAGEILGQVITANKFLGGKLGESRMITNIVLMGSGEPLDNYQNVTNFLRLVTSPDGLNISERNISLSTCGIVPKIKQLADDGFKVTLTISLHATTDQKRQELMPISNLYSISQILDACKYYFKKTNRRVVFEYVLVRGQNDSFADAKALAGLLKGFPTHVNVIPLNSVEERNLIGATRQHALNFVSTLSKLGQSATLRRTLGSDIDGACGQLRQKYLDNNGNIN